MADQPPPTQAQERHGRQPPANDPAALPAPGIAGSLERITKGLQLLLAERAKRKQDFPVIIKPVVHKRNFRDLPEMVEWVTVTRDVEFAFKDIPLP